MRRVLADRRTRRLFLIGAFGLFVVGLWLVGLTSAALRALGVVLAAGSWALMARLTVAAAVELPRARDEMDRRFAALPPTPDLTPLQEAAASLDRRASDLVADLGRIETRLTDLEAAVPEEVARLAPRASVESVIDDVEAVREMVRIVSADGIATRVTLARIRDEIAGAPEP